MLKLRSSQVGGRARIPLSKNAKRAVTVGRVSHHWRKHFMGRLPLRDFRGESLSARRSKTYTTEVARQHLGELEAELRNFTDGNSTYTPIMNEDGEITDGRRIINIDEIGQAHAFGGQKGNSVPRVVGGDHQPRCYVSEPEHRQQDTVDVVHDLDGFLHSIHLLISRNQIDTHLIDPTSLEKTTSTTTPWTNG